jgi:5-deoxy-D-glucuronate isomerase
VAKVDDVLDALVAHTAQGEGATAQAVRDAHAAYKGEPTNEEKIAQAKADEEAESEKGKAANKKQVEDEAKKADSEGDDDA